MTDPVTPKKRKRRKKKKNYYFTEVHEKAILDYCASTDMKVRTELYIGYIQPAFDQMVDKIAYTYKFTSLPNIDVLKDDCKIWLTTILDKFDPSKGSKAFSYFSVITKNWFIHKVKRNKFHNENIHTRETREFWENFFVEVETWDKDLLKENEQKVLKAVKILFESSDNIEIFNKKAIYLYLRELTDLNTKQVVNNLNKLRIKYRVFKKKWDAGKI